MPHRAPRPCRQPGCAELVTDRDGLCEAHRSDRHKQYNKEKRPEYHRLYGTKRWRDLRMSQLMRHPFCECGRIAMIAHHKMPHGGDAALFYDPSNLQSVCFSCHEREHRKGGAK